MISAEHKETDRQADGQTDRQTEQEKTQAEGRTDRRKTQTHTACTTHTMHTVHRDTAGGTNATSPRQYLAGAYHGPRLKTVHGVIKTVFPK